MDLGAILRDADGDIIGIRFREIKTRQGTGGASYSELEKLGRPDILRELVRLDRLNDTALSEELADLFRVGIPPDLIKSQIVRYDVDLDAGTLTPNGQKDWNNGVGGRFQVGANAAAGTFDARQRLRDYIESLSPTARRDAFDNFEYMREQFPDLAP